MTKRLSTSDYEEGILSGDRIILSRAITLLESSRKDDNDKAEQLMERILPYSGRSIRVGITGVPGVGKSTFIESIGKIITQDHKLAVVAIDPSSQISRGSILGDKTRMDSLSRNPRAYIRPSVSGTSKGGVASKTRETILLLEAAGFDYIIVETVGVGQSETLVHGMVDFFLLLMLAGAGDELQGIKRGIMEMADALVITKADGDNIPAAMKAKSEYQTALHLFPPKASQWEPKVLMSSALVETGIRETLSIINDFHQKMNASGFLESNRKKQNVQWMHEHLDNLIKSTFLDNDHVQKALVYCEKQVLEGHIVPSRAARKLTDLWFKINES
jgi:LAO/AO transport system kinase